MEFLNVSINKTGLIARWIFSRRKNLHKKKKIFYWKAQIHSGAIAGGSSPPL
jgi:hypothetical protein